MCTQGELGHRTAKARYSRTNRKEFVRQMAQIEHRQAHICRIHARTSTNASSPTEKLPITPDVHHCIGQSQNQPEHIGLFVQNNSGNPAIKVLLILNLVAVHADLIDRISSQS